MLSATLKLYCFLRTLFTATTKEENDKILFSQSNLPFAFRGGIDKFLPWPGKHKLAEGDDECIKTQPKSNKKL